MRGLELRLRRLEERFRKKNNHAPSQHEFLEANTRQRTRNLYTAKSSPAGENWAWDRLFEYDQKMLEKDTENLRQQDKGVLRRSGGVVFGGKEILTVHENRGTPGEARPIIVVSEYYRHDPGREAHFDDRLT